MPMANDAEETPLEAVEAIQQVFRKISETFYNSELQFQQWLKSRSLDRKNKFHPGFYTTIFKIIQSLLKAKESSEFFTASF